MTDYKPDVSTTEARMGRLPEEATRKPYGLGYTGSPVVSGKPNMRFKL